jgi:hypothetical protein
MTDTEIQQGDKGMCIQFFIRDFLQYPVAAHNGLSPGALRMSARNDCAFPRLANLSVASALPSQRIQDMNADV